MEIKDGLSVAVLDVLDKHNYAAWSVRVKTYLMAQDLWEIVEATTKPPKKEDDETAFKAWNNKNSTTLNVLQLSCGPDALCVIKHTSSAQIAWNTLAVVLQDLKKDNYVEWSVRVKTYLMAHDLWEIIEATTEPPRIEDDEATFKAWSKKNSLALHATQISCGPDTFSNIIEISSAKTAWDTLAEKYDKNTNSGNENDDYVQYEALKKAVQSGDWNATEEFLKRQPGAAAAKITFYGETALYIAINAGHEHIVEKLVDLMSEEDLAIPNCYGNTPPWSTINVGNYRMAACMLRKNNNLLNIKSSSGIIPSIKSILNGDIELGRYLYSLTPLEDLTQEKAAHGATLCTEAIYNRRIGSNELFAQV